MTGADFLLPYILNGGDWKALEQAIARLIMHAGWKDVNLIGKSGDKGADILANRHDPKSNTISTYLFQVKAVSSGAYIGVPAIKQALRAQAYYSSKIIIVATNGDFGPKALNYRDRLQKEGIDVRLWNGIFLRSLASKLPAYSPNKRTMREYQNRIYEKVVNYHGKGRSKCLFIVATGLGKTVIAANIADTLFTQDLKKILVLCHSVDLAAQLQQSFWREINKQIPTRLFLGGEPPIPIEGINFGLYQTLYSYLGGIEPDEYDLIIVDEAHHALANAFAVCINQLKPKILLGMTATPWRGDGSSIESIFGEPVDKVSLVEGMKMGYLSRVDYRLMSDNIVWEEIPKLAKKSLSIKDLNKRLFLPQRDESVLKRIMEIKSEIADPRIAVFSPSKAHAKSFASLLTASGIPAANLSIDDHAKRHHTLMRFTAGELRAITAVDVLNEGIDVPDVNILVFLRATHSRRIFVQQLGRGLRIAQGKEKVVVLDFVTDIRRIAAVTEIDKEAKAEPSLGEIERILLQDGVVTFNDIRMQSFVDVWLQDVTDLQYSDDAEKLIFPILEGVM